MNLISKKTSKICQSFVMDLSTIFSTFQRPSLKSVTNTTKPRFKPEQANRTSYPFSNLWASAPEPHSNIKNHSEHGYYTTWFFIKRSFSHQIEKEKKNYKACTSSYFVVIYNPHHDTTNMMDLTSFQALFN